jgi:hypothetical protein
MVWFPLFDVKEVSMMVETTASVNAATQHKEYEALTSIATIFLFRP